MAHSRSPAIHTAAAEALGIDLEYRAYAVRPGKASAAVGGARELGLRGLSVTMPHKEAVIEALDELSYTARKLHAVNCITNDDGLLRGDNTDGEGFLIGLDHDCGEDVTARHVVVLGAGGAARAIVLACARAGAESVTVLNRNVERARSAVQLAGTCGRLGTVDDLGRADVVVNATSLGMADTPNAGSVPFDVTRLHPYSVVVDIVYNPLVTPLLSQARDRGLRAYGGLSMLAGQAAAQFTKWTGCDAPIDVMLRAAAQEPRHA